MKLVQTDSTNHSESALSDNVVIEHFGGEDHSGKQQAMSSNMINCDYEPPEPCVLRCRTLRTAKYMMSSAMR